MDTSLRRHSPSLDKKSFFTGQPHGDAGDHSDDEAPVRIHQRQACAIDKPPVQAMGHFTPLGELRVSMVSPRESGARPRSLSLSPAAPQPHLRARSLSLSYVAHEGSAPLLGSAPVNVDTKHVIGAGAAGQPHTLEGEPRLPVDPAANGRSRIQTRQPPAPAAPVQLLAGSGPAPVTLQRVSLGVDRLVAMAGRGATAQTLCETFDEEVLRLLFRAKPPAGQGALGPALLTHALDRLAAAYPQLEHHQRYAGLFDALAGALFKRLGGHRMREPDSQCVFGFVATLAQGRHAERRRGLIVRTLGQMRHALGDHRMSAVRADAFAQALCQARQQWGNGDDDRFAQFIKVNLSGLLGPAQGRGPRAETVVDALVRAARRLERSADLAPVAKGLADAVMEGVSDAADQRTAVRHAASLWLSSLMARGEVDGLIEVCRGMAMHSHEATARAALVGLLDAMAGLIADAKTDQIDAMAAGIASCCPGLSVLRQWLDECHDRAADPGGSPELAQAAQRVSEAVARKANLDLSVRAEALTPAAARPADPAAVNALMRDLIARAQAGATPQQLAGRFTIEIARYRAPDAAGGPRLQGAQFEAIAARLLAASGVLLRSDPEVAPLASSFGALLGALVDAGGGVALGQPERDCVLQQSERLIAKVVTHAKAAKTCVQEALSARRQLAPERETKSGTAFAQQVATVQAQRRAPVATSQVRVATSPSRMPDPHAAASAQMRREVAHWCRQLAARSEAGAADDDVAAEFASLLEWKLLAPGAAGRVSLSGEKMKLVLEELLAASQALMGTSPMHGLLARLLDKLFVAGRGAGKRLADATQAWVLTALTDAQAKADAAHKCALAACVATSLVRNGVGPATPPKRGAALLATLVSAVPADADKSALREWSGAVNGVLRALGWFGHDAAPPASDAARKSEANRVEFAAASRALTAGALACVASALVMAEAAAGRWVPLVTLKKRLTAMAADVLRAAESAPSAQERHARREACIAAMKGAYLLSTGNSATAELQIRAVLDAAQQRVPEAEMAAT